MVAISYVMNKISEIISKQVISLYDAKIEGTIENAFFNENFSRLKGFIVFNEREEASKRLYVKDIYYTSNNNYIVKNSSVLSSEVFEIVANNPVNKDCFSIFGESLGKIVDIILDGNIVLKFSTSIGIEIKPSQIVSVEDIVVVNTGSKKLLRSTFAPKQKKSDVKQIIVKIQEETKILPQIIPPRFIAKNIVGAISKRTVLGYNNEIVIKKGEQITQKVLEKAKLHNVLNQLV